MKAGTTYNYYINKLNKKNNNYNNWAKTEENNNK